MVVRQIAHLKLPLPRAIGFKICKSLQYPAHYSNLPSQSVIALDDFESPAAMGKYLRDLVKDKVR